MFIAPVLLPQAIVLLLLAQIRADDPKASDARKVDEPAPSGYIRVNGQYLPGIAGEDEKAYTVSEAAERCESLGEACTGFTCFSSCTIRAGGTLVSSSTGEITYKKVFVNTGIVTKDKSSSKLDEKLGRGGLVEEWDKTMDGFVPELLLTFPLPPRSDEYFYEDVTPPYVLRGGFFASAGDETSSVDFKITNPAGDVVFDKADEADGLFHFMARKKGTYTFIVSNHKWMEQKMVTFALGKGNETTMQAGHVDAVDSQVQALSKTLRDIQTESTYLWIRQKSHMKAVESIHYRVFGFCIVEFVVLLGVTGFQAYAIKGMLSDRRIL